MGCAYVDIAPTYSNDVVSKYSVIGKHFRPAGYRVIEKTGLVSEVDIFIMPP